MEKKKSTYRRRLSSKYRIVIFSDQNFEEKLAFSLKGWHLLGAMSFAFVVMFTFTFIFIAFTPLKEYMPGYEDVKTSNYLSELIAKTDSLNESLLVRDAYIQNIKNILTGNVIDTVTHTDPANEFKSLIDTPGLFAISDEESNLRREFEDQDFFSINQYRRKIDDPSPDLIFYPPVRGIITESFNPATAHYAIDVVAPANTGVKAALEGVVIFSEWSATTGYVLIIQHAQNFISVYKHNSALLKKVGNFVRAGEVVSIIGESGSLASGPHLHFELWREGRAVDPEFYIIF